MSSPKGPVLFELDETTPAAAPAKAPPVPDLELPLMVFPEIVMYFGGVGAAVYGKENGFGVAADPRREGGIFNPDA